jgi:hypothetical protein
VLRSVLGPERRNSNSETVKGFTICIQVTHRIEHLTVANKKVNSYAKKYNTLKTSV